MCVLQPPPPPPPLQFSSNNSHSFSNSSGVYSNSLSYYDRNSIDSTSTLTYNTDNMSFLSLAPTPSMSYSNSGSVSNSSNTPLLTSMQSTISLHLKNLPWAEDDSDFEVEETLPPFGTNIDKALLDKLTPNERTVQEAINEIIHTEQKHVRNLKIMKNQFYDQIKNSNLLTKIELALLFPNLDLILRLHCKLLIFMFFLKFFLKISSDLLNN